MGCFGYMCVGCEKSIRGEERAVLKHIRHGKVLGETVGVYDSYGGVEGHSEVGEAYRGHHDGINGHLSIHTSEFKFPDSPGYDAKLYKGEPIFWMEYREKKKAEGMVDLCDEMYEEWRTLPYAPKIVPSRSGVEAWHEKCYNEASQEIKDEHIISESDPNQSWGKPRKKFM